MGITKRTFRWSYMVSQRTGWVPHRTGWRSCHNLFHLPTHFYFGKRILARFNISIDSAPCPGCSTSHDDSFFLHSGASYLRCTSPSQNLHASTTSTPHSQKQPSQNLAIITSYHDSKASSYLPCKCSSQHLHASTTSISLVSFLRSGKTCAKICFCL